MRRSHGSSTNTTGSPGSSSKRTARGLRAARWRFSQASTLYKPSRLTGTRRIGRLMAACSCKKPRSYRSTRFVIDPAGFEVRTEQAANYREEKIDNEARRAVAAQFLELF